jgi:hypothetical protein
MVKSRSGRKFTKVGVKQVVRVGVLLRSKIAGCRIIKVIGRWDRYWVCEFHHNTSWVPGDGGNPHAFRDGLGHYHYDYKKPYILSTPLPWEVVKEVE